MYRGYRLSLTKDEIASLVKEYINDPAMDGRIREKIRERTENDRKKLKGCIPELLPSGMSLLHEEKRGLFRLPFRADVFLAHAEKDAPVAEALASFLSDTFGLRIFLDSWYTEHADTIRKEIGFRECCGSIPHQKSLEMENVAVSGTLVKIIDDTECFIFLDTPFSERAMDPSLAGKDYSGRLYYELLVTRLIRRSLSDRQRMNLEIAKATGYHDIRAGARITEQGSLLLPLSGKELSVWKKRAQKQGTGDSLDLLYELSQDHREEDGTPLLKARR